MAGLAGTRVAVGAAAEPEVTGAVAPAVAEPDVAGEAARVPAAAEPEVAEDAAAPDVVGATAEPDVDGATAEPEVARVGEATLPVVVGAAAVGVCTLPPHAESNAVAAASEPRATVARARKSRRPTVPAYQPVMSGCTSGWLRRASISSVLGGVESITTSFTPSMRRPHLGLV